jgi:hypothetical protein
MSEILAFQAVLFVCGTCGFVASLRFLLRFLELRHERAMHTTPDALAGRIERMEAMLESTALEVERIGEANRFVAKLLAERVGVPSPSSKPERVITPH